MLYESGATSRARHGGGTSGKAGIMIADAGCWLLGSLSLVYCWTGGGGTDGGGGGD